MNRLRIGDIVARKSYGEDVFFKVVGIRDSGGCKIAMLKAINYRLEADAPEYDLVLQSREKITEYREKLSGHGTNI